MKIALIPARSGSKRLPKKNKINFLGKPLIEYSVLFAEKNNFDDIIISTDDEDLLNYAVKRGINYIQRPKKISLDTTPIYEVLKHMISEKNISNNSTITLLQPTNPLREKNLYNDALEKFQDDEYDSLISISKNSKKIGTTDKYFKPLYNPGQRSQDINSYYENGLIYILKSDNLNNNNLFGNKIGYLEVCDEFGRVDIDNYYDLKLAEIILENNKKIFKHLL